MQFIPYHVNPETSHHFNHQLLLLLSAHSLYEDVAWLPLTTNLVERFFSKCSLTYSSLRKNKTPYHLEYVMYLRLNDDLWSARTIQLMMTAKREKNKNRRQENGYIDPVEDEDWYLEG